MSFDFPEELKEFIKIALKEGIPDAMNAFQTWKTDEFNKHLEDCKKRTHELNCKIAYDSAKFDESWNQIFAMFAFPQHQLEFDGEMKSHYAAYNAALAEYEKCINGARIGLDTTIMLEQIDIEQKHANLESIFNKFINKLASQYLCDNCSFFIIEDSKIKKTFNYCLCEAYKLPVEKECETMNCFMCDVAKCNNHGTLRHQIKTIDEHFFHNGIPYHVEKYE